MSEKTTQAVTKPIDQLKSMLNADTVRAQFENALKENTNQFLASLIEVYSGDAKLQLCDTADIVRTALKAATLGLTINKELGFAYIAAYNCSVKNADGTWGKKMMPTFLVGYKGYTQLALRTGQYHIINSDVVYEGEIKSRNKLTGLIEFNDTRTSDRVVGYFAYIKLVSGFEGMVYMTVDEMARYARRYGNVDPKTTVQQLIDKANNDTGSKAVGWEGNFTDMALKTVLRRLLSKRGYLSTEMQTAISAEDVQNSPEARDETIAAEEVEAIEVEAPQQIVAPAAQPEPQPVTVSKPTPVGRRPLPKPVEDGTIFTGADEEDMPPY